MDKLSLIGLSESERNLLAVLVRYGRDGRAITAESLAANAGVAPISTEFSRAIKGLVARGLIKRAGSDPIPGAPVAFRLSEHAARQDFELPEPHRAVRKQVSERSNREDAKRSTVREVQHAG